VKAPFLCVNIDHVATLRQARRADEPDTVETARLAESAGAIGITVHLREDRRHIQDADVWRLKKSVKGKLNLEMALTQPMLRLALKLKPDEVTLVPERRQELTTEGGLEVAGRLKEVAAGVAKLQKAGIVVSLFITPEPKQILASKAVGADFIELHTGAYANAYRRGGAKGAKKELARLHFGADLAWALGLGLNAGHGLTVANVGPVAAMHGVQDLNIGHHIVSRAVVVGMERAVKEMITAMKKGKR
jgi:pyridoxine 5-phosphate synthase